MVKFRDCAHCKYSLLYLLLPKGGRRMSMAWCKRDATSLLTHWSYVSFDTSKRALQWHHNEHDGVSTHQLHDCLLNCLFRRISKKTSKLRVTGLCAGNSPVTGEFPTQRTRNAENVSIWWRHRGTICIIYTSVSHTSGYGKWPREGWDSRDCTVRRPMHASTVLHVAPINHVIHRIVPL